MCLGWQWTPLILLLLKKCSHLLPIPKSLSGCAGNLSSSRIILAVWRIMKEISPCLATKSTMSLSCHANSSVHKKTLTFTHDSQHQRLQEELGEFLYSSLHVAASLKPRAADLIGEGHTWAGPWYYTLLKRSEKS